MAAIKSESVAAFVGIRSQFSVELNKATSATPGFDRYSKPTRRAVFLAEMDRVVPWTQLCALIEPVYPKPATGTVAVEAAAKRADRIGQR